MIRLAQKADLPRLLEIFSAAKAFMRRSGNPKQWSGDYPNELDFLEDIAKNRLYVIETDDGSDICACFMMADGPDETYQVILEGAWRSDSPYGVIHRVASDGTQRGILAQAVAFARQKYPHLRIDTHEDNLPMQKAVAKQGFVYRGIIITGDGTPRLAYDWLKE